MKRLLIILAAFWLYASLTFSQSPYETNWKKEIPFISAGVVTVGAGVYLGTLPPIFTLDELQTFNANDVNSFDRFATGNFSKTADHWSDIFLYSSQVAPALFLINKKTRKHRGRILAIYGEAAAINVGLTLIVKSIARRPRPFVFNPEVPVEMKLSRNARTAFLSGHTSITALNTFFVAKVYSDFFPDSKWKPFVWGTATVIPALTGYLRVEAGKHYPTDVIAGYILGATIGILVPQLHKTRKLENTNINLNIGPGGAFFTWKFAQN